jgi:protein-S-isoprenylcysteine O-methyltransferase Ste14
MSSLYPKLLVFLQFSIAGIIILLSHDFFSHTYAFSVLIMGACIGLWAINHNKLGNFNIQPKHKEDSYLVTTGIYKLIRHPMYTSVTVMMLAFVMATPTWSEGLLFLVLVGVLVLKAKREEIGLMKAHPHYREYKEKTKYFIPYIL